MEENRAIDGYMMLWLPELEAWAITYEVGVNKIPSHTNPEPVPELRDHIEIQISGCECLESNVVYRTLPGDDSRVDQAIAVKYDFANCRIHLKIVGGDQQEISERISAERVGWGMEKENGNHAITINLKNQEIQHLLTILRVKEETEVKRGIIRLSESQILEDRNEASSLINISGMRVQVFISNVRDLSDNEKPCYDVQYCKFL